MANEMSYQAEVERGRRRARVSVMMRATDCDQAEATRMVEKLDGLTDEQFEAHAKFLADSHQTVKALKATPAKDPPKPAPMGEHPRKVKVVGPDDEQGKREKTKSEIVAYMGQQFGLEDEEGDATDGDDLADYFAAVEEEQDGR